MIAVMSSRWVQLVRQDTNVFATQLPHNANSTRGSLCYNKIRAGNLLRPMITANQFHQANGAKDTCHQTRLVHFITF